MLLAAIAAFFKYKAATNIIVLACWSTIDRIKYIQELNSYGLKVTATSHLADLDYADQRRIQGVLCFNRCHSIIKDAKKHQISSWYKWLVIDDNITSSALNLRHDSDITLLNYAENHNGTTSADLKHQEGSVFTFQDVFLHPKRGFSVHLLAHYSGTFGFRVVGHMETVRKRLNFEGYPLRLATPINYGPVDIVVTSTLRPSRAYRGNPPHPHVILTSQRYRLNRHNKIGRLKMGIPQIGLYLPGRHVSSFIEYLDDNARPEIDSAIRCGHEISSLVVAALNASKVLIQTEIWSSLTENNSMARMISDGEADISGGVLRMLPDRIKKLDYLMHIWPFRVGFTYVAERASSNGMFVEPFSADVWWCCLATGVLLALALRVTARTTMEKEGSFYSAVATCLQQDASAVPESATGRTVFLVLSISSMLIHGYYTSAVVSALMKTARGGPDTLTALADSSIKIAAEDYEYVRRQFFNRLRGTNKLTMSQSRLPLSPIDNCNFRGFTKRTLLASWLGIGYLKEWGSLEVEWRENGP
ncbi:hypothetical protein EVAR_35884_1 [Eumeta japonica]|uniref:Ionotropic glutamate receptor C-terminal domain-containing protein n=1 Tax=Eumeta variegata TaxID=151549 RepID=A0A4C1WVG5_EUMVA|nr:hypothetical protein EVAR_35884_1 [Eumeta japonica]